MKKTNVGDERKGLFQNRIAPDTLQYELLIVTDIVRILENND